MKGHRFYLPLRSKACQHHLDYSAWQNVNDIETDVEWFQYDRDKIEDMVNLLSTKNIQREEFRIEGTSDFDFFFYADVKCISIESISDDSDDTSTKVFTGLTNAQFEDLLSTLPTLLNASKDRRNAVNALHIYLMKLRTAHTNDEIAQHFKLSRTTVQKRMKLARHALKTDFVPLNLYHRNRDDLLLHTTETAKNLYCPNKPDPLILVWDGTYIYVEKSANMEIQKRTYNDHKKRNYIKIMMCVTTDGLIANAYGPYSAGMNDASILNKIVEENEEMFDNFHAGDVMVLDRGFRDSIPLLQSKGLEVKIPSFTQSKGMNAPLTTNQANLSRLVTKVRYVVETKNGHMKTIWKLFDHVWPNTCVPHLMDDFEIGAALLNKYFKPIINDKHHREEIERRMLSRTNVPNTLSVIVKSKAFQRELNKFTSSVDFNIFPPLELEDLMLIVLGTYQIRLAPGYYHEHVKGNDDFFVTFICPDEICHQYCDEFCIENKQPVLMLTKMKSRYKSKKMYHTYVLFDKSGRGPEAILAYCCDCKNGLRTVGSCSHVVCIIWYFGFARRTNSLNKPAEFLNGFFETNNNSVDESDSD